MNTKTFVQSCLRGRRSFELHYDGIVVLEHHLFSHQEYKIPYESISMNRVCKTECTKLFLWATILFLFLTAFLAIESVLLRKFDSIEATLFYGALAILCGGLFLYSRQHVIIYPSEFGTLFFFEGVPSKSALEEFLNDLELWHRNYMMDKFGPSLPQGESVGDELARLFWLKERGALTDEEFNRLKGKIITEQDAKVLPVGFKSEE
jgi:hypothetical protein